MNEKELLDRLLPIGSIVLLKKTKKKLMIIAVMQMKKEKVFEYMGVLYPEGYVGEKSCFLFNHEDIAQIIWRGYEDKERGFFLEFLETAYKTTTKVIEQKETE